MKIFFWKLSFFRFIIVGLTNTIAALLIIFAGKSIFTLGDVQANAIGYIFGMAMSFLFNRSWTFHHHGNFLNTLYRFIIVTSIAYLVNLLAMLSVLSMGIVDYVSHAIGAIPYVAICYVGYRKFVFKS